MDEDSSYDKNLKTSVMIAIQVIVVMIAVNPVEGIPKTTLDNFFWNTAWLSQT